jgi:hypothetical protein
MRRVHGFAVATAAFSFVTALTPAHAQDASKAVAGGGVSAPGWTGQIDPKEKAQGGALNNSKFAKEGDNYHVTTGPATSYWNPANKASGDYVVKAKFTEPKFMGLNDHPHPYGVFIGGNDMGTDQQSLLYCEAYGNGNFILRGFGPAPFQVGRMAPNAAVHKAGGAGEEVSQEIALAVKGDKVECSVNGTVVASVAKADVVTAGKLKSTDGVYGIRFAHNTEGIVSGFGMSKQ